MTDYIKREDALRLIEDYGMYDCDIYREAIAMPAADVAPIVRCKDCRWWIPSCKGCEANPCVEARKPKDFCSCGERKDDETI